MQTYSSVNLESCEYIIGNYPGGPADRM